MKPKGVSHLYDSVSQYKHFIKSRSLIVIISDFLINIDEIKKALFRFGKHEIKVIQVLDKSEKEISVEGDYKLKDAETDEVMKTYISRNLRNKYKDLLDEHTNQIKDSCSKMGISFYQVTTDKPLFDSFYEILR
jgi:uncharacterized protein (DUF58 family)